jgi:kumamolisin
LTRLIVLILIALPFSLSAQTPAPPSASTDRITFAGSIKEVPAAESPIASGASPTLVRIGLNQAQAEATLDFSVALKMRDFAELQARVSAGEIISLDEMAAKYFPTAAEYKTVVDWVTTQGLAVKGPNKYNLSVFASGTVAQVELAFGTDFGRVKFAGVEYSSALSSPSVPVAIAGTVLGINGLQPHLQPRTHSTVVSGQQKLVENLPPYTIGEIAKAYNVSSLRGNGTGQKIGIVIDTFPAASDLTAFWAGNAIAQSLNNIEHVQVVSGTLPSPSVEATLDVEWSSGMAPGAKVRVYATTDFGFNHIDRAYQAIINDLPSQPQLHQVSLSYGLGETYESTAQMETDDQYFATLAAAGVTVFVSSGDGGSSPGLKGWEDKSGPVQVESPANDPNVTAVGGTSLYLNTATGAVSGENAWFYGGGGSSRLFARPGWQKGTGAPTGAFRLVPDVGLAADINTGGYLFFSGQVFIVGGTSWGAPTWAAFCARINQVRANSATPSLGLLGPKIYPLLGSSSLRSVTAGSNGLNGFYNAGPAFDLCTGLGVPNMNNLSIALQGGLTTTVEGVDKDFTGDGYGDLVLENSANGALVIWLLKNGIYLSSIGLPTLSPYWRVAGVGDFLGNGQSDLVLENAVTGEHIIWILKSGVFQYGIELPPISPGWHVAGAGDFNGDGFADLVWENSITGGRVIWLLVNGTYSSSISLPTLSPSWHISGIGDFLGNGQSDLAFENSISGSHDIWILNKGVLQYGIGLPAVAAGWYLAGVSDFNRDGQADLVWENTLTGQRTIWLLKNGVYSSSVALPTLSTQWDIVDH